MNETEFWEQWRKQRCKALEPLIADLDAEGNAELEEYLEAAMQSYGDPGRN